MKIHLVGDFDTGWVWINDTRLDPAPSLKLRNHSPTGFSWGYGGSGPAQLALAILLKASGDPVLALAEYQGFKQSIIARLPQGYVDIQIDLAPWIDESKIHDWKPVESDTRYHEGGTLQCARCGLLRFPIAGFYRELGPDPIPAPAPEALEYGEDGKTIYWVGSEVPLCVAPEKPTPAWWGPREK